MMNNMINTKYKNNKYGKMGMKIRTFGDVLYNWGESTENWGKYGISGKTWNL